MSGSNRERRDSIQNEISSRVQHRIGNLLEGILFLLCRMTAASFPEMGRQAWDWMGRAGKLIAERHHDVNLGEICGGTNDDA